MRRSNLTAVMALAVDESIVLRGMVPVTAAVAHDNRLKVQWNTAINLTGGMSLAAAGGAPIGRALAAERL
jgi:hypothetical protein